MLVLTPVWRAGLGTARRCCVCPRGHAFDRNPRRSGRSCQRTRCQLFRCRATKEQRLPHVYGGFEEPGARVCARPVKRASFLLSASPSRSALASRPRSLVFIRFSHHHRLRLLTSTSLLCKLPLSLFRKGSARSR